MALSKEEKKTKKAAKLLARKHNAEGLRHKLAQDHLQREIAAHDLWYHSLENTLRHLLLKIKEPLYRQNIEALWVNLERAYDKKDALISRIIYLKGIGNNQYQRTIANFCLISDRTINTFLSDLENMVKANTIRIEVALKHGRDETFYHFNTQKTAETHLYMLLYSGHEHADIHFWNMRGENVVRKDEDYSAYLNIRETLSSVLEDTFTNIWEQYKAAIKTYIACTAENQKQVRKLRKKESMLAGIITVQAKQINLNSNLIKNLRSEITAYKTGERQAHFRDRREKHKDASIRLKRCMNRGLKIDELHLSILVKMSDDTIEWLVAAQKKCEKIMLMAALCRKLETGREKVLPYGSVTTKIDPLEKASTRRQDSLDEATLQVEDILATGTDLGKLWRRMSKAELIRRSLVREKMELKRENLLLESLLRNKSERKVFLETVKCNSYPRPLKRSVAQVNTVEGSLEIKKFIRT